MDESLLKTTVETLKVSDKFVWSRDIPAPSVEDVKTVKVSNNLSFIGNIRYPKTKKAKKRFRTEEDWQNYLVYLNDHILGEPQDSCTRTAAENKAAGFVGLYSANKKDQ
jgi:hypothetical protein